MVQHWHEPFLGLQAIPPELTDFELRYFFSYTAKERAAIFSRYGDQHRLAVALQIGINEMDPPLCGAAVISHNEVSETDHQRTARRTSPMKHELSAVAIDLAKKIFHLVGADRTGKILWRKRLTRNALMPFMAQLPPVLIGIEACGGAHYWARRFREHGHDVKLLAPQFVKPFVKSNKNDMRDAEAIAEAVTRPTMRFVPIKEVDQQDIQALHRVRERLIGARTALINEVHGSFVSGKWWR